MSLLASWVLFPLVLAAVGAGWGVLVQRLAGERTSGALIVPLGLAGAIVVASLLTAWSVTAPASITVIAVGAALGLALGWPERGRLRRAPWPGIAAVGVLLAYGAPILLSGQATFAGFVRLDDTATWLGITDQVMGHGRALSYLPSSTYRLILEAYVGNSYPLGSFMLLGVGHGLTGIDSAWVFQPYLACCAAALGLSIYALAEPLIASERLRALIAFLAAQAALLYGYSLWGGIKELTASFLLVLGAVLVARAMRDPPPVASGSSSPSAPGAPAGAQSPRAPAGEPPSLAPADPPPRPRALLPLAIVAAALIDTLGAGSAAWVLPALALLLAVWVWRARGVGASAESRPHDAAAEHGEREPSGRAGHAGRIVLDLGVLSAVTAMLALPMWVVLSSFLASDSNLYSGSSTSENLGNLIQPLSGWQLAGVWPVGDFRLRAPTLPTAILVGFVLVAACLAIWLSVRRGQFGVLAYVGVALAGCAVFRLVGSTPWVIGKALAISSPALLTAALVGGALLVAGAEAGWHRPAGVLVLVVIGTGVVWSNVLAYHDVLLAPRTRLAELQHIGQLLAGRGPTLLNEYEVYGDRHFLREGAPVEPAEYRSVDLPLRDGTILTKSAWADLDSFAYSTIEPYRSIVTARSPAESRPPSIYRPVWQGTYYELWQRPARPDTRIIAYVPLGESNALPYCGVAENGPDEPLCSADPAAVPPCPEVQALGRTAARAGAQLIAYQRPQPVVARGDQLVWPAGWVHDAASHTLFPNRPGTAVARIRVSGDQAYELWLGGSFSRGFQVSVDGRYVGQVKDQLRSIGGYAPVTSLYLSPGIHAFAMTYPHAGLTPGSGDNAQTSLTAISLQPLQRPRAEMLTLAPSQARDLCGRSLDWIEIVAPVR